MIGNKPELVTAFVGSRVAQAIEKLFDFYLNKQSSTIFTKSRSLIFIYPGILLHLSFFEVQSCRDYRYRSHPPQNTIQTASIADFLL